VTSVGITVERKDYASHRVQGRCEGCGNRVATLYNIRALFKSRRIRIGECCAAMLSTLLRDPEELAYIRAKVEAVKQREGAIWPPSDSTRAQDE
jgi:hypothetical protein